jgi:hypothetical protein
MRKSVMFCMKMNSTLLDTLKMAAAKDSRNVTSLLQNIIAEYLEKEGFPVQKNALQERRRFPRKKVELPGITHLAAGIKVETAPGVILDISLGGVLMSYPNGSRIKAASLAELPTFELRLQIPSTEQEISFNCKARRIFSIEDKILVGAAFRKPDENNLQTLRSHLM